jgi:hypothetical protein
MHQIELAAAQHLLNPLFWRKIVYNYGLWCENSRKVDRPPPSPLYHHHFLQCVIQIYDLWNCGPALCLVNRSKMFIFMVGGGKGGGVVPANLLPKIRYLFPYPGNHIRLVSK